MILPLMPWPALAVLVIKGAVALGIVGGAGALIYKKTDLFKKKKQVRLAVLGLKGSGKTTLQNALRGTNLSSTPLSGNDADSAKIIQNGKTIILSKGLDVSGVDEAITHLYENEIKKNDHIIFITDSKRILENGYLRNSRGVLNKINKIIDKESNPKKVILIGSHRDQLISEKDLKKFDDAFLLKKFDGINEKISTTFLVDLTSPKDLKHLKKSLFN